MQTETIDKSQQATPSIDEELIDTLIAISVVAKRLAANLRQQKTEENKMSKMSELSQVLDEMIACGEGMIKAANAIKDIFSSTEEAPEKKEPKSTKKATKSSEPAKAEGTPEPTYTKEDVRAVLASKSAAGYKKEVKELLEKYGALQLKQVNPDDYAAILKEAEVIGNA